MLREKSRRTRPTILVLAGEESIAENIFAASIPPVLYITGLPLSARARILEAAVRSASVGSGMGHATSSRAISVGATIITLRSRGLLLLLLTWKSPIGGISRRPVARVRGVGRVM